MTRTQLNRNANADTTSTLDVPAHALIDGQRVVWFSTPPPLLYGPAGVRLAQSEIMELRLAMGQREAVFDATKPFGLIPLQLEAVTPALVMQPWFAKLAPYLADSNVAVLWSTDAGGGGEAKAAHSSHSHTHGHLGGLKRELGRLTHKHHDRPPPAERAPRSPQHTGHVSALTALVAVGSVQHSPEAMHRLVGFDAELVADDIRRTGLGVFFGDDVEWLLRAPGGRTNSPGIVMP
ncbi:uncharacterized protein LOC62_03G003749 [Vanrija pseudolonga]|uniref:Uncharacterized protein n=1 Tax=Vanrija pseudolonga TaxID=143232 RepID=A0AAF0Y4N1_9TREE|nr:hypothetical protein LOC62_03G003749 [Vanrija pseudolonga]